MHTDYDVWKTDPGPEPDEGQLFDAMVDDLRTARVHRASDNDWNADAWHVAGHVYLTHDDYGTMSLVARNVDDSASEAWPIREDIAYDEVAGLLPAARRLARWMSKPRDLRADVDGGAAWLRCPDEAAAYLHRRWPDACDDEAGELFSLACALYWHCTEWHGGQWSMRYRVLSSLGYAPGASMHGIEDEEDDLAVAIKVVLDEAAERGQ